MRKERRRIELEPELELQVVSLDSSQRRALASMYRRWARQLEVSATILANIGRKPTTKKIHPLPKRKLGMN